jgi:hypothetical protein
MTPGDCSEYECDRRCGLEWLSAERLDNEGAAEEAERRPLLRSLRCEEPAEERTIALQRYPQVLSRDILAARPGAVQIGSLLGKHLGQFVDDLTDERLRFADCLRGLSTKVTWVCSQRRSKLADEALVSSGSSASALERLGNRSFRFSGRVGSSTVCTRRSPSLTSLGERSIRLCSCSGGCGGFGTDEVIKKIAVLGHRAAQVFGRRFATVGLHRNEICGPVARYDVCVVDR